MPISISRSRERATGHEIGLRAESEALSGNREIGYDGDFTSTYFASDALSMFVGAYAGRAPDWLVWQRDNFIGRYDEREAHFNAGLTWTVGSKQELRVKLQAIGLGAKQRHAYRVDSSGMRWRSTIRSTTSPCATWDFRSRSVDGRDYGRRANPGAWRLLADSFQLRDDEQLLIKLSYRFER